MLPTTNPSSPRLRIAAALLALAPALAALLAPAPAALAFAADPAASQAEQQYTAQALKAINVARAKKHLFKVRSQACMTRYAQGVAEKDAAAGRLSDVEVTGVSRRCRLHYAIGINASGAESGKVMINQVYLRSYAGGDVLMRKTHRITGLGAAQAKDGTWYFMVVMSDRRL